jgi:hypothetical protein
MAISSSTKADRPSRLEPNTQKRSSRADVTTPKKSDNFCLDPGRADLPDPEGEAAAQTLAQQYLTLMQDSNPSDDVIRQLDGILEIAQFDSSLSNMLNYIDDSLIEKLDESPPKR